MFTSGHSRWCVKQPGLCHLHGRSELNSRLLILTWSKSSCSGYLESKSVGRRFLSPFFSLCFCFSYNMKTNKQTKTRRKEAALSCIIFQANGSVRTKTEKQRSTKSAQYMESKPNVAAMNSAEGCRSSWLVLSHWQANVNTPSVILSHYYLILPRL